MSEYNFETIKQSFDVVFRATFNIKGEDIPTVQELDRISEIAEVSMIKIQGGVFLVPANMNKGTALALLCFFMLLGRNVRLNKMSNLFQKMKFLLLEKNLYTLAGIEIGMFSELLEKNRKKVNLALGMASFLYFEKYNHNEDKKIQLAKDYPIYGFFRSFLDINKPKMGFGIPKVLNYDGVLIQTNDLPPKSTQINSDIEKYYNLKNPRVNSRGVTEFEPSELVQESNELMRRTLNQGHGIDRALKRYGINIITLNGKKSESEQKELLNFGLNGVPDENDANVLLSFGPIKGSNRAMQKVESDYKNDASFLNDIVRATFVCKNADQLAKFNTLLFQEMLNFKCKLTSRPKDKFSNPTPVGYGDINTIFVLPNGFCCEIQISLIEMVIAKSQGHEYYEIQRTLETLPELSPEQKREMDFVTKKQIEIYDGGRIRSGLKTLAQLSSKSGKRANFNEVKFYDFDGMPAFTKNGKVYYIDYSNRFKEGVMDTRFSHEAMLLTRQQFDTLVYEFKNLVKIKD